MTDLDMTASAEARSDQINAADLVSGPRTFTIKEVIKGKATQPFDFILEESPGKAYRPNLGMRRVFIAGWGPKTGAYHGRRVTLFNEPTVIYAGVEIGGIRISHMSHLDEPLKTSLAISQKKKVPYIVQPLPDAPTQQQKPTEPIEVRIPKAVEWFAGKGVELSALEAHVNSVMAEWGPADLDALMAARDELTELNAQAPGGEA